MRLFVDDDDDDDDENINGHGALDDVNAEWRNETERRLNSRAKRGVSSKIINDQQLTSVADMSDKNSSEQESTLESRRTDSERTRKDSESRPSSTADDADSDAGSNVDSIVLGQQQHSRRARAVSQELVDMARELAWTLRTTESAMASVSMGMSVSTGST